MPEIVLSSQKIQPRGVMSRKVPELGFPLWTHLKQIGLVGINVGYPLRYRSIRTHDRVQTMKISKVTSISHTSSSKPRSMTDPRGYWFLTYDTSTTNYLISSILLGHNSVLCSFRSIRTHVPAIATHLPASVPFRVTVPIETKFKPDIAA